MFDVKRRVLPAKRVSPGTSSAASMRAARERGAAPEAGSSHPAPLSLLRGLAWSCLSHGANRGGNHLLWFLVTDAKEQKSLWEETAATEVVRGGDVHTTDSEARLRAALGGARPKAERLSVGSRRLGGGACVMGQGREKAVHGRPVQSRGSVPTRDPPPAGPLPWRACLAVTQRPPWRLRSPCAARPEIPPTGTPSLSSTRALQPLGPSRIPSVLCTDSWDADLGGPGGHSVQPSPWRGQVAVTRPWLGPGAFPALNRRGLCPRKPQGSS